jgi:glucose-6-phosphate dehydrogenase assembly protein OpcA
MTATLDTSAFGTPVEIGQIGRELKKLWERDNEVSTRASLINFAVYCEGADAMRAATDLIFEFTKHHACRALLVGFEPSSPEDSVQAWINAHCHLSRAGAKQICCEQISFLFAGKTHDRIASIVFSNLDSDLPLVFWWQGEFPEEIDQQLWSWVDRLIFDSQSWSSPREQFERLNAIICANSRLTPCDLNWTRSLHLRQALAQIFDAPQHRSILDGLQHVSIGHAPEYRSTALLLAGWIAAQLKLNQQREEANGTRFISSRGNVVTVDFKEVTGRSISKCCLASSDASVDVQRDPAGDFFRVAVHAAEGQVYNHLLPAGSNDTAELLLEEIGGGGKHRVYLRALPIAEALLESR